MDQVNKPIFNVIYNKHNITAVVTPYLMSITYKDAEAGKSDEVQLQLSNASGIWLDEWWPDPGICWMLPWVLTVTS